MEANLEPYSEPCWTSKMKVFAELVAAFSFWRFSQKAPYYVLRDSQFTSAAGKNLRKKLYPRREQGFEFVFAAINYSQ